MMLRSLSIATLALLVAQVVLGSPVESQATAQKREAALARLTPGVRAYLETLDPKDYTLDLEPEQDDTGDLESRNQWLDQVIYNCQGSGVAMTFDDGMYIYHKKLSQEVTDAGEKVTFFINGNNYRCAYNNPYPARMLTSLQQGHQIASHTWSHPSLPSLSDEEIDEQVDLTETLFLKTLGVIPKYIRPPYGDVDGRVAKRLIQKHGYKVIVWSDSTEDADGGTYAEAKSVYDNIKKGTPHIILNHETQETTVDKTIPYAIKKLDGLGIKSQTVHSCLGASGSPYKVQTKPGTRDASWTCDGTPQPGAN